jgi:hypothetical protein
LVLVISGSFFAHEYFGRQLRMKLRHDAARVHGILSALFPANVRERMLTAQEERLINPHSDKNVHQQQWKKLLGDDEFDEEKDGVIDMLDGSPIADLFSSTSVMFAGTSTLLLTTRRVFFGLLRSSHKVTYL